MRCSVDSASASATLLLAPIVFSLIAGSALAQDELLLHWSFDDRQAANWRYGDEIPELVTMEIVTGTDFDIGGLVEYLPGVSGSALKFDGFSTYVEGTPKRSRGDDRVQRRLPKSITIEAWIALASYPWNWAPILTTGNYKITGFYFGVDSRGRVGFHVSDGTSVWHECNSSVDPATKLGLKLRKWHHVVGTYRPGQGLKVYINGELAGTCNDFQFEYGIAYRGSGGRFRLGQNVTPLAPSDPIRGWATYPSQYSLDGIIDEVKIHRGAWSADKVAEVYRNAQPKSEPTILPRPFPTVKPSGRFGANYTRLKYYPEWDALWPAGDDMDVVVQFEKYPTKLIFWRGTRYSPCWVSENNRWMADQSREVSNNWFLSQGSRDAMPTGCIEHMSDTQCRSSRVAIIENNDARAVVNWRYLQMDVRFRQKDLANNIGLGEWGNEYYYVYPDGQCVRKVLPGYGGWQETIFLSAAGTRPEDNVDLAACTLVNMAGESKTYSWASGYPKFDLDDAVIQMTNFRSKFKPFVIFREGGSFEVFDVEIRPEYSHFPWWNHWPVSQIISDGRSAIAPDRAAHSSLSWGKPGGDAALYGMTDQKPESLASVARSWNFPPENTVQSSGYHGKGYDYTQRAYLVHCDGSKKPLNLAFAASAASPVCNLVIVVENWPGQGAALELNGEAVPRSDDFRYGVEFDAEGNQRLIAFIVHESEQPTLVSLNPID